MPPSRSSTSRRRTRRSATGSVPGAGRRATGGTSEGDPRDRPAHPGTRLRVLAPDALRPVPGREPPAHAPGRRGGHPGGVRGTGPVGRGRRTASSWRRGTPAGCCPQIFRTDDVLLEVELPDQRPAAAGEAAGQPARPGLHRRRQPRAGSTSSGRRKKKDEVNKSGQKIDGRTLPAVTQLFTEHYMVEFLLHNTIGAWWCARHGITGPPGGAGVPEGRSPGRGSTTSAGRTTAPRRRARSRAGPRRSTSSPCSTPAAGAGISWSRRSTCWCRSAGTTRGCRRRTPCDAVLRENLFGLELDPRCTQIAAFALAMAAWKYPGDDGEPLGYRPLPPLNIACSGQGVVGSKEDWARFANGDTRFREGMERLYDLFRRAPTLGSLIDPRTVAEDLFALGFDHLEGHPRPRPEEDRGPDRSRPGGGRRRGSGHRLGGFADGAGVHAGRDQRPVSGSWQAVPRSCGIILRTCIRRRKPTWRRRSSSDVLNTLQPLVL